jgi:hypothetical protein
MAGAYTSAPRPHNRELRYRAAAVRRRSEYPLGERMAQTVEVSLKIPSLRVQREDKTETISNSDVRFSKRLELDSIPKAGAVLVMTMSAGEPFECEVVRSDWHEDKNLFVVACRYMKRSISPASYQALLDSSDWALRPLL